MSDPFDCQTFHELCMDYRGALMTATHNGPQIAYEKLQAYCRGAGGARVEHFPRGFFRHNERYWRVVPADPTAEMLTALYGEFLSTSAQVSRIRAFDEMLKVAPDSTDVVLNVERGEAGAVRKSETPKGGVGDQMPRPGSTPGALLPDTQHLREAVSSVRDGLINLRPERGPMHAQMTKHIVTLADVLAQMDSAPKMDVQNNAARYLWMKAHMGLGEMFPLPRDAKPRVRVQLPASDRRTGSLEWDVLDADRLDAAIDAQIADSAPEGRSP